MDDASRHELARIADALERLAGRAHSPPADDPLGLVVTRPVPVPGAEPDAPVRRRRGTEQQRAEAATFAVAEHPHVWIPPGHVGGQPCIRGSRVSVAAVLQLMSRGFDEERILGLYQDLTSKQIRGALEFAAFAMGRVVPDHE